MSIIPEPPAQISESMVSVEGDATVALTACTRCHLAGTCRIAAGLARLARIRGKLVPNENNMWLRGRIDEYLGIQVCLAGVFGIGPSALSDVPAIPDETQGGHRSITLEMALRHRDAISYNRGPTGVERPKPGDRVEYRTQA